MGCGQRGHLSFVSGVLISVESCVLDRDRSQPESSRNPLGVIRILHNHADLLCDRSHSQATSRNTLENAGLLLVYLA